jgi:6-phosphogluconolactonase (cycloisomerase 2 family)
MKQTKYQIAIAIAVTTIFLSACKKDNAFQQPENSDAAAAVSANSALRNGSSGAGHVYLLSNQAAGNKVLDYTRSSNGTLTLSGSWPTGDNGTGGGLGSQGAVILASNGIEGEGIVLLAVNAGSNTISSLKVKGNGIKIISTISSGGIRPISITQFDDLVYVLNAGGDGNISGFRLGENGSLRAIATSTRPLTTTNSVPAEIAFVREGNVLAITEKATNTIMTYTVDRSGLPGTMHTLTSANLTPFGFAAGYDKIYVTEAAGGAPGKSTVSSYRIQENGAISLINGPIGAGQTAACWAVVTNNNKYVYAANTGSGTISSFGVSNSGVISLNAAVAASAGAGAADAALSHDSKFLYVRNGGSSSISVYAVAGNGSLTNLQTVTGLEAGTVGISAD